jgi:DNA gyrase/topoisomerase IV subunit B
MRQLNEVRVDIADDGWITVTDDGPGIAGNLIAKLFTTLNHRGTYDGHTPHIHFTSGFHSVGLAVVSALSERVEVESTRRGARTSRTFARGRATEEPRRKEPSSADGTSIRFKPDAQIFGAKEMDRKHAAARLQELAWLMPTLRVFFQGRRLDGRGGVRSWAEQLAAAHGPVKAVYGSYAQHVDDVVVDLAVAWSDSTARPKIRSFVNLHPTVSGPHLDAVWIGLEKAAQELYPFSFVGLRDDLSAGLMAVVHVGLFHPKWGNPTKDHLTTPEAGHAVYTVIKRDLPRATKRDRRLAGFLRTRLGIKDIKVIRKRPPR